MQRETKHLVDYLFLKVKCFAGRRAVTVALCSPVG